MTDITLDPITSGYNLSKLNANFDKVQQTVNEELLHTTGGNSTMLQPLDMNGYPILNLETDPEVPGSLLTVGEADERYYNTKGDTLEGPMVVGAHPITGLRQAQTPTEPVRKNEFDSEVSLRQAEDAHIRNEFRAADQTLYDGYTAADANIQEQLTGQVPLEASAFSPISWHDQSVDNSVNIPANKNAWSFGPTMTVSPGQTVTVGEGSFWTIANGEMV